MRKHSNCNGKLFGPICVECYEKSGTKDMACDVLNFHLIGHMVCRRYQRMTQKNKLHKNCFDNFSTYENTYFGKTV